MTSNKEKYNPVNDTYTLKDVKGNDVVISRETPLLISLGIIDGIDYKENWEKLKHEAGEHGMSSLVTRMNEIEQNK